jgi:SnoaL-like domain
LAGEVCQPGYSRYAWPAAHRRTSGVTPIDPVLRLEAIEKIRFLKARYFRGIDCKDWDSLPDLFTRDLRIISPDGKVWMEGGTNFAASLKYGLENATSCHQGFTAEIEVLDEGNARGIWAMQDVIEWPDRHPREGWKAITGRGHYHETYRFEQGHWRIASLSLTRLRLDITWPEGHEPANEKAGE